MHETVIAKAELEAQIIQLVWFASIIRIAWRVVSGQGAEDVRSDEEE